MQNRNLIRWHKRLIWLGGLTLLSFAVSGFLHPLMSWTGPTAAKMQPPAMQLSPQQLQQAQQQLQQKQGESFALVKLLPYQNEIWLQLSSDKSEPRQYQSLSGIDLSAQADQQMAVWLASWYTGIAETELQSVQFQTTFDHSYPEVNRLLPVYKVQLGDLTAYIHTESQSLASLSNSYKDSLQLVFRTLHSWNWLKAVPELRLALMSLLLVSVLVLLFTGSYLLWSLPSKIKRRGLRLWHYRLAWIVFIPVACYAITGFYHLLHNSQKDQLIGLALPAPALLPDFSTATQNWPELNQNTSVRQLTLVQGPEQGWYWRMAITTAELSTKREQRFQGQATEQQVIYLPLQPEKTKQKLDDSNYAEFLASFYSPDWQADTLQQVRYFGMNYDFRNKRLPVWQLQTAQGDLLFVDTSTGQRIEQLRQSDQLERTSFSLLHKWNLLMPLTGRFYRDLIVELLMLLIVGLAAAGFVMRYKTSR
ncbi:hypothetical protein Rhein_3207 [Rheinheimera sp. A13L]|uniref:PepSY domain-containing protein n=1 Tax=Rheinheimera sp. A13L TaxID=506534 RepID=UPI00021256BA|nr:PepSY domain-containing protein [Rheinheimera sp. A13L]EGM76711.1 hypothetical protein Rhein_3207 [Rheinheimera sp. A13L]